MSYSNLILRLRGYVERLEAGDTSAMIHVEEEIAELRLAADSRRGVPDLDLRQKLGAVLGRLTLRIAAVRDQILAQMIAEQDGGVSEASARRIAGELDAQMPEPGERIGQLAKSITLR